MRNYDFKVSEYGDAFVDSGFSNFLQDKTPQSNEELAEPPQKVQDNTSFKKSIKSITPYIVIVAGVVFVSVIFSLTTNNK